jgi:four helix bundle protein
MNEKSEMGLAGLQVWQRAMTFAGRIYKDVLPVLPAEEKWAMSSQLRRAAQSVPANLAEGHGRYYYQDNVR